MYDKDYFIELFEQIPESKFTDKMPNCALGHCGVELDAADSGYIGNDKSAALISLFGGRDDNDYEAVYDVNDGTGHGTHKFGDTPKKRILNYLKSL